MARPALFQRRPKAGIFSNFNVLVRPETPDVLRCRAHYEKTTAGSDFRALGGIGVVDCAEGAADRARSGKE